MKQIVQSEHSSSRRIGIVVVHYNNATDTVRCVESIMRQSYPHWVVVVVDNSPDHPSGVTLKTRFQDERVLFVTMPGNLGYAAGCNAGARQLQDRAVDYLWFLNADTEVAVDAAAGLIETALQSVELSKIGSLCSAVTYATHRQLQSSQPAESNDDVLWGAGGFIDFSATRISMGYHGQLATKLPDRNYKVDYSPGCSIFIPLNVWLLVGEFDEKYFMYFEETDWCVRASRLGYLHLCVPSSRVVHFTSLDSMQKPSVVYYYNRNLCFFWWKFGNWRQRWKIVITTLLTRLPDARKALLACDDHTERTIFSAHYQAAKDFLLNRTGACWHEGAA